MMLTRIVFILLPFPTKTNRSEDIMYPEIKRKTKMKHLNEVEPEIYKEVDMKRVKSV